MTVMEEKKSKNLMINIATFIVNKRNAFVVLFAIACIYSALSISKVSVIDDLTDYMSDSTETRQGLDIQDEEFITYGSAKVLITNISYENARKAAESLEEIDGISDVLFYDYIDEDDLYEDETLSDYYKDASALLNVSFDEAEETELSQKAMQKMRKQLSDYQVYFYTTVDKDDAADLQEDMKVIMVLMVIIILGVLLFTSGTYMEILIFAVTFLVAILLNMGTNYWFGSISFISNAVAAVLQLALSLDYAIIFFHRFMEEHEKYDVMEAVIVALSKAIPEISSSSLTTVSGMVALMLMQFGIGPDLGLVLTKAILFSLLTVFLLMPALIIMSAKAITRTAHRNFVPSIRGWGRLVVRTRFLVLPVFFAVMAAAIILSSRCEYIYDTNSIISARMNEYMTSKLRIQSSFELPNPMAIIIPEGSYQNEAKIMSELEQIEELDDITGLANIEVGDDKNYILIDELTPREFAEVADVDLDLVRMLYRYYALDQEKYSAFMMNLDEFRIPIIDMVDFMYDQKESGGLDLDDDISDDIDDMHEELVKAREQLSGDNYTRIVFTMNGPVEGKETFDLIDRIRNIVLKYYEEAYVIGDSTGDYDMAKSFTTDNVKISVLTALFVGIILLFTFQSAGLPILLVATIQSSIWINFSIPALQHTTMYFLSYLIVSAIQMGATIDYAIVITSRYMALRAAMPDRKQAVIQALDEAFPTIVTSGSILTLAGFTVGNQTSNAVIASLGKTLGTGTLISIILVMTVLPQILVAFDKIIEKTAFSKIQRKDLGTHDRENERQEEACCENKTYGSRKTTDGNFSLRRICRLAAAGCGDGRVRNGGAGDWCRR